VNAPVTFQTFDQQGWYDIVFPDGSQPFLQAGKQYALVFPDDASFDYGLETSQDTYPGGNLVVRHTSWEAQAARDLLFRTYIGTNTDTIAPTGNIWINDGAIRTKTRLVSLNPNADDALPSSGVEEMRLKNAGGAWGAWIPYVNTVEWKLTRGEGKKTVYVQFKDAAGNVSAKASDSITYRP